MTLPLADIQAPVIDYKELSPLMATVGGSIVVLMVGLLRGRFVQTIAFPALTKISLVTAIPKHTKESAICCWRISQRQCAMRIKSGSRITTLKALPLSRSKSTRTGHYRTKPLFAFASTRKQNEPAKGSRNV